jgi:hypothetical protein
MISPKRIAHHDASGTINASRSGMAAWIAASSSTFAGRVLLTRRALPAPRIRHGLASMISSRRADAMIERIRS